LKNEDHSLLLRVVSLVAQCEELTLPYLVGLAVDLTLKTNVKHQLLATLTQFPILKVIAREELPMPKNKLLLVSVLLS
jgi:hypothetical protein